MMPDPDVEREAAQAQSWLTDVLTSHMKLLTREHGVRLFTSAIEKESTGAETQWTDMEKLYMTLTNPAVPQPEARLRLAFLMVLELNFATRLGHVRKLAIERCVLNQRTGNMGVDLDTIRQRIVEKTQSMQVDHFACAISIASLTVRTDVVDDNQGCCPVCQNSYTDLCTNTLQELLDDFPIRIKYCGHIIGKSCLEQWMSTPKINEARYPHRTCPLCRVKIEGVPAPTPPASLRQHIKTKRRAMETLRALEEGWDVEVDEALETITACMSEEIACEEMSRLLQKAKEDGDWDNEVAEKMLEKKMAGLNEEKRAWGFRGDASWRPLRNEWMNSGDVRMG